MAEFDKIMRQQESLHINNNGRLTDLRNELIDVTNQRSRDAEQRSSNRTAQLTKIELLLEERANCIRQNKLVQSLYVTILNKRGRDRTTADEFSNAWLFNEDLKFTTWLESGSGVYLISGKVCSFRCMSRPNYTNKYIRPVVENPL